VASRRHVPDIRAFAPLSALIQLLIPSQLYTSLLGLISISARRRVRNIVVRHLNAVLLVTFAVYVYRDVFPLATFNRSVLDLSDGWLLWAKVAALIIGAVVVPLSIPRQYTPVDPKVCSCKPRNISMPLTSIQNPMEVPSPELVAPLFSMMTYYFLDPLVFTVRASNSVIAYISK
jgi:hypothetical protein